MKNILALRARTPRTLHPQRGKERGGQQLLMATGTCIGIRDNGSRFKTFRIQWIDLCRPSLRQYQRNISPCLCTLSFSRLRTKDFGPTLLVSISSADAMWCAIGKMLWCCCLVPLCGFFSLLRRCRSGRIRVRLLLLLLGRNIILCRFLLRNDRRWFGSWSRHVCLVCECSLCVCMCVC